MTPVDALDTLEAIDSTPEALHIGRSPAETKGTRRPHASELFGREASGGTVNWLSTIFVSAFHICAVVALFMFTWKALFCAALFWLLAINMGIGMGYHRLLTHRGYKVPKWLEYFLATCGTMALEGGPIFWVAMHRVHHQVTDQPGDPHTPHDGGWWSHAGWILSGRAMAADTTHLARYAPDLAKDRFYQLLSKFHWIPLTLSGFGLLAFGRIVGGTWYQAWSCVMWALFLRVTIGLHATWLVNSATHMWGSRRFPTRDDSRNNWWVALLTGGEGWHNNHHAHPVSAKHGLAWYEVDPNYWGIWILKKFGLAKKVMVAEFDKLDPRPAGAQGA